MTPEEKRHREIIKRLDQIVGGLAMLHEALVGPPGVVPDEAPHQHLFFLGSDTCATCGAGRLSDEVPQEAG